MRSLISCYLIVIFPFSYIAHATEKDIRYVGFWEKDGIRKSFEYRQGQWRSTLLRVDNSTDLKKAAAQYATPSEWTLFFEGKTYGTISTKPMAVYNFYYENGLQKVSSHEPQLVFRKVEDKFSGWNGKNIRPILVCNTAEVSVPDQWKSESIKKVHPLIFKDLKKRLKGEIHFCKNENCEGGVLTRGLRAKDIHVSSRYKDATGNELHAVALNFSPQDYAYCETEGDGCKEEGPFWYFLKPNDEMKFLTQAAALVELADLNHDGRSEILFWINEYNLNGYELIDGRSHIKLRSTWSYH